MAITERTPEERGLSAYSLHMLAKNRRNTPPTSQFGQKKSSLSDVEELINIHSTLSIHPLNWRNAGTITKEGSRSGGKSRRRRVAIIACSGYTTTLLYPLALLSSSYCAKTSRPGAEDDLDKTRSQRAEILSPVWPLKEATRLL